MQKIKYTRHGKYGTRIYNIWAGMKRRCYNRNDISYYRYGAKGIIMSESWRASFISFYNDMFSGYFDKAQIDRIDNTKGYSKENCRWVTIKEQANNKKNVTLYEHNGEKLCSRDWDKKLGLKSGTVNMRIKKYGWAIERAVTETKKIPQYIFLEKKRGLYRVEKCINGKNVYIGRYKTYSDAKNALDIFISSEATPSMNNQLKHYNLLKE